MYPILKVLNVNLGGKFELGMKLNPTWNSFLNNFKPKGKPSPEKDVNQKTVRKFIPKWTSITVSTAH